MSKSIRELLSSFEYDCLHCIENNSKNDNFKFWVRARNTTEELEVLNHVIENKENFEFAISEVIGNCNISVDFENLMVTIKRKK